MLDEQMRTADMAFTGILDRLRNGLQTEEDAMTMNSRLAFSQNIQLDQDRKAIAALNGMRYGVNLQATVALTENIHQALKMVNGGEYTVKQFILNPNWTVYMLEADVFLVNGPPKTIFVSSPTTENIHLRGLLPGIIPLLPTKVYA
ncbi:hypothetical protein F4804DRAFT_205352 [Jackrogersella minutella]|nr:hypothetical protein F4804DRAFT_205352 [Jackrogersella minutella]